MAVPKRQHTKSRSAKRRTHDHIGTLYKIIQDWEDSDKEKTKFYRGHNLPGMSRCARCDHVKKPHRICGNCGYYDGEEVVET